MRSVLLLVSVIALLTFSFINIPTNKKIEPHIIAIHVNYDLPIVNWDSSIININHKYDVYYYKDLILYKSFYTFDSVVNGISILKEERPSYFIFNSDSLYGNLFYTHRSGNMPKGRLPVDSMLKQLSLKSNAYDSFATLKPDSIYFTKEGDYFKVFNCQGTNDRPEGYSIYFAYTKTLNDIKESFSDKMDTVPGMKLYKIDLKANGAYYKKYNMAFPKRELVLEMKRINADDSIALQALLNKVKS